MSSGSNKWNQHFKLKIGLIVVLSIVLMLQIWVFFCGSSQKKEAQETTTAEFETTTLTPVDSSEPMLPEQEDLFADSELGGDNVTQPDMLITTPYCNLHYPSEWSDRVRAVTEISSNGCIVTFYGTANDQEINLFSVLFVESSDGSFPIGMISLDGLFVDVSVDIPEFTPDDTWDTSAIDDIDAMQDDINYLINKLEQNSAFTLVAQPQQEDTESEEKNTEIIVRTSFCDLYYPAQWEDAVRWEETKTETGSIIIFYGTVNAKESTLFSVFFAESGDASFPIGVLTADGVEMDVSVEIADPPGNGDWSDVDLTLFCGLQETINYVIERLNENPAFMSV